MSGKTIHFCHPRKKSAGIHPKEKAAWIPAKSKRE
jgi:hypothetical protein